MKGVCVMYEEQNVRIVGVEIPFWDKVGLLVGFALASIPALIILGCLGFIFAGLFGMLTA
jgi:hypothetical protein